GPAPATTRSPRSRPSRRPAWRMAAAAASLANPITPATCEALLRAAAGRATDGTLGACARAQPAAVALPARPRRRLLWPGASPRAVDALDRERWRPVRSLGRLPCRHEVLGQ